MCDIWRLARCPLLDVTTEGISRTTFKSFTLNRPEVPRAEFPPVMQEHIRKPLVALAAFPPNRFTLLADILYGSLRTFIPSILIYTSLRMAMRWQKRWPAGAPNIVNPGTSQQVIYWYEVRFSLVRREDIAGPTVLNGGVEHHSHCVPSMRTDVHSFESFCFFQPGKYSASASGRAKACKSASSSASSSSRAIAGLH